MNRRELLVGALAVASGLLMSGLVVFLMRGLPDVEIATGYLRLQAVVVAALVGALPVFARSASGKGRLVSLTLFVFLVSSVLLVAAAEGALLRALPYAVVAALAGGGAHVAPRKRLVQAAGALSAWVYAFGLLLVGYSVLVAGRASQVAPLVVFTAVFVALMAVLGQEYAAAPG